MKKEKRRIKTLTLVLILLSVFVIFLVLGVYFYAESNIDYLLDEKLIRSAKDGYATKFYYDASYGVGEYEPRELPTAQRTGIKTWYSYDEIGDNLKAAFIAVEDRDFFKHRGVDIKRTAFAAFNYLFHVRRKFGALPDHRQGIPRSLASAMICSSTARLSPSPMG